MNIQRFDDFMKYGELQFLKEGSVGKIYTITPRPRPQYALKVIECSGSNRKMEAALKEADMLKALADSPHVIHLEQHLVEQGNVYLLEEYCEPFLLFKDRCGLRLEHVFFMIEDICEALIECRQHGIMHLDVQPGNIFVSDDGGFKLGDFSSGAYVEEIQGDDIKKGYLRGTMAYIAPEVFLGRNYSQQSEICSLGLVIYTLLNQMKLPLMEHFDRINAVSQRLSGTDFSGPACAYHELSQLVMRACAYDVSRRYQTYEELKQDAFKLRKSFSEEQLQTLLYEPEPVSTDSFPPLFDADEEARSMAFLDDIFEQTVDPNAGIPSDIPPGNADPEPSFNAAQKGRTPLAISDVQFSAIAPRRLVKGDYSVIDIVMYEEEYRNIIDEMLRESDEVLQEKRSGFLKVVDDARIKVVLHSPDLLLNDSMEEQIWTGKYLNFSFAIELPDKYEKRQILLLADIYINGIPATHLKFIIKCEALEQQRIRAVRRDILSAFICYASQDRGRVASLIQGMMKARPDLDLFFDVESLRSGDNWEASIYEEIDRRDLLYLCWSQAASLSEWVDREWRYALEKKGIEGIEPLPIDPPDICPPPEELKSKHFNDRLIYMIEKESKKKEYSV